MDALDRFPSKRGQAAAWEDFVKASYPTVWRLCAALTDTATADDLTQETFLRATRALPRFQGHSARSTWVLSIAQHVCMDDLRARYRRERRDQRLEQSRTSPVADPSGEVAARELLSRLEPDRRVAFALTQLFGLTYAEAATVCGCQVGTIRSRVARARADLIAVIDQPIAVIDQPDATSRRHAAD